MDNPCPVCFSEKVSVFVPNPHDWEYGEKRTLEASVVGCEACESFFQVPMPNPEELSGFYKSDYQNYVTSNVVGLTQVNKFYQGILARNFEKRYGIDSKILDFGCGQGAFIKTLSENGFENLFGFDFVEYPEMEKISGVDFITSLDDLYKTDETFDIIRMNHVIEHLVDHETFMPALVDKLNPGGVLIGETPNPDHYTTRIWKSYWGPLHFPYHTVLFSPKGLSQAALRWGLKMIETSGTILPTGWALSFENYLKRNKSPLPRGRLKSYVLLMMMFSPFSLIDKLISPRKTANYSFALRKSVND